MRKNKLYLLLVLLIDGCSIFKNHLIKISFICLLSACSTQKLIVLSGTVGSKPIDDKYAYIDSLKINPATFNDGWQSLPLFTGMRGIPSENCISMSKPGYTIHRRLFKLACPASPEKYVAPKGCLLITETKHYLQSDGHDKKENRYYLQCTREGAAIAEKKLGVAITDEQREEDRKAGVGLPLGEQPPLK
ncbi:hypothetical protein PT286_03495 [Neisseriaceae bacterium ESL0693]|nr:hypothetical protein [Neisseriaceae bacterium ESL0693]